MIRSSHRQLRFVTAALLLGVSGPALAQTESSPPIEETNRYQLRLMMQLFDGAREFSHTQTAAFARIRKGDESWVMVDFGDGAVISGNPTGIQAGGFTNTSAAEFGLAYNYKSNTLTGNGEVADFHNRYVRPLLGKGPALGSDSKWTAQLTLAQLGFKGETGDGALTIELERKYFSHAGKAYVLVHYRIPSFSYSSAGQPVVHWAEGVAVTDPGFGQMYWNAALHRAVRSEAGGSGRPYRFAKTMAMVDAAGKPVIDPREMPEVAPYYDRVYGASNKEVMGFVETGSFGPDQAPVGISSALDVLALSLGENGANQLGELAGAYAGGNRGTEVARPMPMGLTAAANGRGATPTPSSGSGATPTPSNAAAAAAQAAANAARTIGGSAATIANNAANAIIAARNAQSAALLAEMQNQAGVAGQWAGGLDPILARAMAAREVYQAEETTANRQSLAAATGDLESQGGKLRRTATEYLRAAQRVYDDAVFYDLPLNQQLARAALVQAQALQDRAERYESFAQQIAFNRGDIRIAEPTPAEIKAAGGTASSGSGASASAGGGGAPAAGAGGGGGSSGGSGNASSGGGTGAGPAGSTTRGEVAGEMGDNAGYVDKAMVTASAAIQALEPQLITLVGKLSDYSAEGKRLASDLNAALQDARIAANAIKTQVKYDMVPTSTGQKLIDARAKAYGDVVWLEETVKAARAEGAPVTDIMKQTLSLAQSRLAAAEDAVNAVERSGNLWVPVPKPGMQKFFDRATEAARRVENLTGAIADHGAKGNGITLEIKALPPGKYTAMLNAIKNSPVGLGLDALAHTMNALTTANGIVNIGNAVFSNQSSGELVLTRNYGSGETVLIGLGLDFIGLAGNLLTGNAAGLFTDSIAIVFGSGGDILISVKGLADVTARINEAKALGYRLDAELARKQRAAYAAASDARREQMAADIRESREELDDLRNGGLDAEIDRTRAMAQELLEERLRNRQYTEAQALAEKKRLVAAARAENERIYRENLKRPPTAAEWARFNAEMAEALRPDYPTAKPPSPADVAARLARAEEKRRREAVAMARAAAEEAARVAAAAAKKEALARALREAQAAAIAKREAEAEARRNRNTAAGNRELTVTPATFTGPTFTPPVWVPPTWTPPTWYPPKFTPPGITPIKPTNFGQPPDDGDDWLEDPDGPYNDANRFEDLDGVVETDLSRWAEWLATQDVRRLTRLALQAGYPNLASALADAENILRLSQDPGYRRWAMTQPSCGGYSGCGPSFLERWAMKSSIVALGDILNASRGIFSTAGLSDVGISGLNLAYILRDFGIEDGDTVNIKITQFGRTIFTNNNFVLRVAGTNFNIGLRPGVASLEIFAVNEGTARPNTAEITLSNVTQGESVQQYSLATGETATLRIVTKAPKRK